jgi:hypothetical protein
MGRRRRLPAALLPPAQRRMLRFGPEPSDVLKGTQAAREPTRKAGTRTRSRPGGRFLIKVNLKPASLSGHPLRYYSQLVFGLDTTT